MMSTQSSYGVRISTSPSRASSVPAFGTTASPCDGNDEGERVGGDRHRRGDLDHLLRVASAAAREWRRETPGRPCRNAAGRRSVTCFATSGAAALPVLAAFDQQRIARIVGIVEERVVAQPAPGGVTAVDDDVLGHAERLRELERPCAAGRPSRAAGSGRSSSADRAGSRRRRRAAASARARSSSALVRGLVEHFRRPQPVEVLVDAARRERIGADRSVRYAATLAKQIDSVPRVGRHSAAEQPVERDRAADLVAVRQRLHEHVRTRARRRRTSRRRVCRCCPRPSGRDRETRPR